MNATEYAVFLGIVIVAAFVITKIILWMRG